MKFDITHKTHYRYTSPVVQSQHLVHMSPRLLPRQTVMHHSLIVEPAPAMRISSTDSFGNPTVLLDMELPHKELFLQARSTIIVDRPAPIDLAASTPWDRLDARMRDADGANAIDVMQFQCASRLTTPTLDIADYARACFPPGKPVLQGAYDLTLRIFKEFTFDATATDLSTPITQVFKRRRGVCQDFAHLSLACLRALRIPSRYVSGYILTHPPPGQPKLQGTDASHAWISVWSPEASWVDFDPTNGLLVSDEHIAIAVGRDYDDISPISGVLLGGGEHSVDVGVDVTPAD